MVILGLNYYFHDSSACLVVDGELIIALEEERFTRNKHTREFPENAIAQCLAFAGLEHGDIDHIAVSIKPTHMWPTKLLYGIKAAHKSWPFIKHELIQGVFKQKNLKSYIRSHWSQGKVPAIEYVEHHLSHAAGSFFVSPYDQAAIMAMDGSGEWACSWTGYGEGSNVECYNETYFPNSMGAVYESVTEFCGFKPNYDEGKTMGLAPMGDPQRYLDAATKLVKFSDTGTLEVDLDYFTYQYWGYTRCSQKFYDVFGAPRDPNGEFEQRHMDVAAAFQKVLEERALEMAVQLKQKTAADYLIVAGGVSLNSVMNGELLRKAGFKDIYVMPAAGDGGTCIGAAYYLHNQILGNSRSFVHSNPYIGNEYSNDVIEALLKRYKLSYREYEKIDVETARLLAEGNIIGWFQGRMEIGPRALGARSILANPADPGMKDKINHEVKFREAYRPFAPSTTAEACADFFDIAVQAPFMLKVCAVREDKQNLIPAVTHVDGSARVQTVNKDTNALYHSLITELGKHTGVPVVLNTSFNIQGEPIVESPTDAIRCFFSNGLDKLVIGKFVVSK